MALRIGIVGTGWFAGKHAEILAGTEDVEIAGIVGSSKNKGDVFGIRYDAPGYESVAEMAEAGPLDAVYICVPPMAHGEIERELIERGIPFLVEKPLGADAELPQDLLGFLRLKAPDLVTSVGYHFRYQDNVRKLKEALHPGRIGMATGLWMGDMPQAGWWRRQESSGGQFIEQTTHIVDLLRYCAGEVEEVQAVYASRFPDEEWENTNVHDIGTVTLKLKSGAVANISNTCVLPPGAGKVGLSFYAREGLWEWTPGHLTSILAEGERRTVEETGNPYERETEAFLHAVRTGDKSGIRSDYADACKTQEVTFAALQSALTGRSIKL
ncbi:Gfo/Idh/MocA family oxidoreductase [Saccharibacillus sp. CPCC 101409]|uniref:Gfo/Idh/MocA family protein n=1 Tax=Saccharibacillus sp. CPCC 101409 TaxID=3058041 RepID=UPI0026714089|nr:Gfo/Idh/MocA family oxidoreductase [Saccharibacillus sp. CPCC 101409]MDO3411011.1 Gfo/Idh/MocA family oxidoreductase [Saccharibacillus sp. CPCC 101409]